MSQINIAIVGLGFGAEFIPIYQRHPDANMHAICQRTQSKLDEIGDKYGIAKRYTSYDELLEDPEVHAVHINSPIPDHGRQSIQALKAADINFGSHEAKNVSAVLNDDKRKQAETLCEAVYVTLKEQSDGWKSRSLFERQWVIRDFKKTAGMPVEEWLETLRQVKEKLQNGEASPAPLEKLAGYYEHLADLAKGYEKDRAKLEENLRHVYGWRDEVNELIRTLS